MPFHSMTSMQLEKAKPPFNLFKTNMSTFQKWAAENTIVYPITDEQINSLSENSLTELYTLDDTRVKISKEWLDTEQWPQPGTPEFERELLATVQAVKLAKEKTYFASDDVEDWSRFEVAGLDKSQPFVSAIFDKYGIKRADQLAEAVHNDRPTQYLDDAIEWLDSVGAKKREWLVKPTTFGKQFTETTVFADALVGMLVLKTSYAAFAAKWYYGLGRPEEVFGKLFRWELDFEVSGAAMDIIKSLCDADEILADEKKFTTYPEGSPTHPSRPAMHSAVAAIVFVLSVLYDLDEYQRDQLLRFQSNISFGRTFAWVHYPYDNIIGINLGIQVASAWLIKSIFDFSEIDYNVDVLADAIEKEYFQVSYAF